MYQCGPQIAVSTQHSLDRAKPVIDLRSKDAMGNAVRKMIFAGGVVIPPG